MTATIASVSTGSSEPSIELKIGPEGTALLAIDVQGEPVNVINERFLHDFGRALDEIEALLGSSSDSAARLRGIVIFSAKPGGFIAGADLNLIRAAETSMEAEGAARRVQALCDRLEGLPITSVAAINGAALGGGLEVALACDYRVAAESSSRDIGLVEGQLGLIPAGGGTQRLPRLIGLSRALPLILASRRLAPWQALRAGIVDQVVHPTVLMEAALKFADPKGVPRPPRSLRVSRSLAEKAIEATAVGRAFVYRKAKKDVLNKGHPPGVGERYPAPLLALEAIRAGRESSPTRGLEAEARNFGRLAISNTTHNLIDIFLDSNQLKREQAQAVQQRPRLNSVGVVGAGLMGAGIGQAAAMSGMGVRIKEVDDQALAAGLKRVHDLIRQARRSRRLTRYEADRTGNRVSGSTTYSGFARADLVVEAAVEDLGIKREIIADVEATVSPETIIGTNTSALPIDAIAGEAAHPERIVGIHFFSPVHRMPLVEVVRGPRTSDEAVAIAAEFGRKLGKNVVVVKDGPGFYTTRVLGFMMNEAVRVFEEGASIEDIDRAMVEFGFPVGPMALMDEVGLDVAIHVAETLRASFPDRLAESKLMDELAKSGRKGKRTGRGFYLYRKGKKTANPAISSLPGRGSRHITREEIQERLSLTFVNEAAHCLTQGIVASGRDADLAAIFGLGFPPFLGGPFRYVDTEGAGKIVDRLDMLEKRFGPRFGPAECLVQAAPRGTTLR